MINIPDKIMDFEIKKDFPTANKIRKRISDLELAIKYTKHTVRLHQNKKKLKDLHRKLERTIFNYNKFGLFNYMDEIITKELGKKLKEQFDQFVTVRDFNKANKFFIN